MKISKLAIANRGEVAVRIIRACHELGIKTVLLHSEADTETRAYRLSDEKICIGPAPTAESYLNIQANVDGALSAGAQLPLTCDLPSGLQAAQSSEIQSMASWTPHTRASR